MRSISLAHSWEITFRRPSAEMSSWLVVWLAPLALVVPACAAALTRGLLPTPVAVVIGFPPAAAVLAMALVVAGLSAAAEAPCAVTWFMMSLAAALVPEVSAYVEVSSSAVARPARTSALILRMSSCFRLGHI